MARRSLIPIIGRKFGRWTILDEVDRNRRSIAVDIRRARAADAIAAIRDSAGASAGLLF